MGLALRQASPSEEENDLIAILERNLTRVKMRSDFRWRLGNPAGKGWWWVIYERGHQSVHAMTSVFPRPMYIDRKLRMCGQVGNFVVDAAYRSLGPAVMLQRATFQTVDSGALSLCYDCPPHDQGMSTFMRLGLVPSCELIRYALVLRGEEVVQKKLGKSWWTKPLISGVNTFLRTRRASKRFASLEISCHDARFGDEYNHLDKTVSSTGIVRTSRSAELLNWRYRDRPECRTDILVARRQGELIAFLAMSEYDNNGHRRVSICDLFGHELEHTGLALLEVAADRCRQSNVVCLEGNCAKESIVESIFKAAGFRARERSAHLVAYAQSGLLNANISWPVGQAEFAA